ncbi:SCO2584 family spore wall biosynthesis protein [Streptomyces sp. KMM 9044]|uniref:SCO2584 family spore wall biosynthesis protein n=1 Tax=Streptomyces sp. KMM 9044 TaxID=2744474 RepID=UPI003FA7B0CC
MPEDVGGTPFSDGGEPDDDHDRGVPDEEFDSVVFDEAFIGAALVHEPTAVERLLAAARARAEASEAEAHRTRPKTERYDDGYHGYGGRGRYDRRRGDGFEDLDDDTGTPEDDYGITGRPYGRPVRWHRPVAWVLALVMGIGMVALAFSAVYRGSSADNRQDPVPPPASTGLEQGGRGAAPSASADYSRPDVPVIPGSP